MTTYDKAKITAVNYNLPHTKEDFLKYLVEEKNSILHGSSDQNIEIL